MRPDLIVAHKEFMDHLTSKRFLAIFAILMLLSILGMVNSMNMYHSSLDSYKQNQAENQQQPGFTEQVAALQKQISDMEASGGSADDIQLLKQRLDLLVNPPAPSILMVYGIMNNGTDLAGGFFSIIVMLLAMALGFDLITKEKEESSLKSLLSHPVYRDEVINGKLLGALATLTVVMGSAFLVSVVIMMFYGAMPSAEDMARFGTFFIMALLYSCVFFAISAMFSAVSKTSAMAILGVLAVMVAFVMLPSFAPDIAGTIMGPAPEMTQIPVAAGANSSGSSANASSSGTVDNTQFIYDPAVQQYYWNKFLLSDTIDTVSPIYAFGSRISSALLYQESASTGPVSYTKALSQSPIYREPSLLDSLAYVWVDIVALLVWFVVPVGITYILFMRIDVR